MAGPGTTPVHLLLVLLASLASHCTGAKPRRPTQGDNRLVVNILWLESCGDLSLPVHVGKILVRTTPSGEQAVDLNFTIARGTKLFRSVQAKVDKCRDRVSSTTCEYFGTFTWKTGLCALMVMKDALWSPIFDGIAPTLRCPIKAGNYTVTNATFDLNNAMVQHMRVGEFIWTGTVISMDDDDSRFMCLRGAITGVRQKS